MLAKTLPPLRGAAEASEEPTRFEIIDLALFIDIDAGFSGFITVLAVRYLTASPRLRWILG